MKLVGIVNADTGFQLPDFRAAERTFSLLVQVSGRAGRSLPDGKVLIQTFRPGAPAIVMAQEGRLEEFYTQELETRRQLGFPPFSRLIRLVVRGQEQAEDAGRDHRAHRALRGAAAGGRRRCWVPPSARWPGSRATTATRLIVRTTRFTRSPRAGERGAGRVRARPGGLHRGGRGPAGAAVERRRLADRLGSWRLIFATIMLEQAKRNADIIKLGDPI